MGCLIDGVWRREDQLAAHSGDGAFVRPASSFRHSIKPGGRFPPEAGRYLLYVSLACPWAHRTIIVRALKRLEPIVGLCVTHWLMGEDGWNFAAGEGVIPDPVAKASFLHEVYRRADPSYSGRVTVPVLWDTHENTIVNNESAEIIRIFNSAFDTVGAAPGDYYPESLRAEVDTLNARVYDTVNNGVYKAGFAASQAAYEAAVGPLFDTLDWLEARMSDGRSYLFGDRPTEADVRLFTTLVRFDVVYHGHFKCNVRRLADYAALSAYARRVDAMPGVAATVDFSHVKRHYYMSQPNVNPSRIVPMGPERTFRDA